MASRGLRATATRSTPDLVALLLLFAESNRWLRITDIAELLGVGRASASRLATRADGAGLIDKLTSSLDRREVACRLSIDGRVAVDRALELLRPIAAQVLGTPDREWIQTSQRLLGPAARIGPRNRNWGWRAGVRAGLPAGE